jgi:hypothetical protein
MLATSDPEAADDHSLAELVVAKAERLFLWSAPLGQPSVSHRRHEWCGDVIQCVDDDGGERERILRGRKRLVGHCDDAQPCLGSRPQPVARVLDRNRPLWVHTQPPRYFLVDGGRRLACLDFLGGDSGTELARQARLLQHGLDQLSR